MRLSQSAWVPTGRVDLFSDVLRCFVDWQSGRTRRVLNRLAITHFLPDPDQAARASEPIGVDARTTPLVDASALLHWVTGERSQFSDDEVYTPLQNESGEDLWVEPEGMRIRPRPGQAGPTNRFGVEVVVGAELPVQHPVQVGYTSYLQTRKCLYFLTHVLADYAVWAANFVRPFNLGASASDFLVYIQSVADEFAAGRPLPDGVWMTDDILRLLAIEEGLRPGQRAGEAPRQSAVSLRRRPGVIWIPYFHPFEMSNDLVGWNLVDGVDPIVDRRLWPKPTVVNFDDPTPAGEPIALNAGWRLSQTVRLYSGQSLVSEYFSVPGTRSQYTDYLDNWEAADQRFGLITMTPLAPDALPLEAAPAPLPGGAPFLFALGRLEDEERTTNVRFSGLEIFLDSPAAWSATRQIAGVFDLDGGTGTVLDRIQFMSGRRKPTTADGSRAVLPTPAGHLIQIGRTTPTKGTLIQGCYFRCAGPGILRFGPHAEQSLVVGGEFNGFLKSPSRGVIQWDEGSIGNWVVDGSAEFATSDTAAFLLMNGRGGAFENFRREPSSPVCSDSNDLIRIPQHEIHVGPKGIDNVVVGTVTQRPSILDEGVGTWVRDYSDPTGRDGAPLCNQTWNNLLTNPGFAVDHAAGAASLPGWSVNGDFSSVLVRDGIAAVKLSALAARHGVTASQTVSVWPALRRTPPVVVQREGEALAACLLETHSGTVESPILEGARSYVLAVRVGATPNSAARVTLRAVVEWLPDLVLTNGVSSDRSGAAVLKSAKSVALPGAQFPPALKPAAAPPQPAPPPSKSVDLVAPAAGSFTRELQVAIKVPRGTVRLEVLLEVLAGTVTFSAPALVEGARMPSNPVPTIGPGGGHFYGGLQVGGVSALLELSPQAPAVAAVDSEIESAVVSLLEPWLGADTHVVLEKTPVGGNGTTIVGEGLLRYGESSSPLTVASTASFIAAGDQLAVRRRNNNQMIVPLQLEALTVTVALNQAM